MKQIRYRTAIRHLREGNWDTHQDVRPGALVQFQNIITGRAFVRRVSP